MDGTPKDQSVGKPTQCWESTRIAYSGNAAAGFYLELLPAGPLELCNKDLHYTVRRERASYRIDKASPERGGSRIRWRWHCAQEGFFLVADSSEWRMEWSVPHFLHLHKLIWAALIVVDESVKRILTGDRKKSDIVPFVQTPIPFQGGYQDFLPFTTMQEAVQSKGPPRLSIFDDLCYYIQEHHSIMELSNHPSSSTLFLSKIVASESTLFVQYLNGVLSSLAWQLSRQNKLGILQSDWIEQRWSDLIAIQRRIGGYSDNVKGTMLSLTSSHPTPNQPQALPSWKDSMTDFRWLETRLEQLQGDARSLIDAFSGLAGIVGNQQAISEARSVSYLNVLGTTFVPLSLIASILSLPSPYKPGAPESWKYWAIGIPLVVGVYAAWFGLTLIMKKRAGWPAARIS
jgi:hypothetical protein